MIRIENTEIMGWEHAIRGMRNPKNSWDRSDSYYECEYGPCNECEHGDTCSYWGKEYKIGPNDLDLMRRLASGGPVHAKYRRMIVVYADITAPLYWFKEFDTYKIGAVANSCSTMHKVHTKEFVLEDFSCEHLMHEADCREEDIFDYSGYKESPMGVLNFTISALNYYRNRYLKTKDKKYWWQMIQLLPSSYNQKRTVMMNYEVLAHIWNDRRTHKLDEWAEHKDVNIVSGEKVIRTIPDQCQGFCDWIKTLPYSELITR